MPLYANSSGQLLGIVSGGALALRGCCCSECALVEIVLGVYSSYGQGQPGDSGSHGFYATVTNVCSGADAMVQIEAETLASLYQQTDSATCVPRASLACAGSPQVTANIALVEADVVIPYRRSSTRRHVIDAGFSSSRLDTSSDTYWIQWALSVSFHALDGAPPKSYTLCPAVDVVVAGTTHSVAPGVDFARQVVHTTYARPGGRMDSFGWDVYFD